MTARARALRRNSVANLPKTEIRRPSRRQNSLFVSHDKLVEPQLAFARFAHAVEQLFDQAAESRLANGVIIVFSVAAGFDEAGHAQQCEMVADSGLTLAEPIAQSRHVEFGFTGQVDENSQPRFIGKELENLDKFLFQLIGQLGEPAIRRMGGRGQCVRSDLWTIDSSRTFLCRRLMCGPLAVFWAKSIVCQRNNP